MKTINSSKIKFIFNPEIIEECLEEINEKIDKEKFFNDMINKRINICEKLYMNDIDKNLDLIIRNIEEKNIKEIGKIIRKLCKISENVYYTEIEVFKKLL